MMKNEYLKWILIITLLTASVYFQDLMQENFTMVRLLTFMQLYMISFFIFINTKFCKKIDELGVQLIKKFK